MICTHTSACVVQVCFCHHACRCVYLYISLWTWYIDIHHMRVLNLLYSFRPWHPWVWLQVPIYPSIKWEKCLASQMIAIIEMWSRDKKIHTIFFGHFGFMGFHGAAYLPWLWHKCVYNKRSFLSDQFVFFFLVESEVLLQDESGVQSLWKAAGPLVNPFGQNALVFSRVRRWISAGTGQKILVLFFFLTENINGKQQTTNKSNQPKNNKRGRTTKNNTFLEQRHCAGYRLQRLREVENSSAPLMTFHLFRVQSELWILVEKKNHKNRRSKSGR